MKVLTIDIDYIMGPSIETYNDILWDSNPTKRWLDLFEHSGFQEKNMLIDQSNVVFCYEMFLSALKKCKNVHFAYEHDSILYQLHDKDNIDLINIDHHDDVFLSYGAKDGRSRELEEEKKRIIDSNWVDEGKWVGWLAMRDKIQSYTWISNSNSSGRNKNDEISKVIDDYKCLTKEQYKVRDQHFDYIFVCLSPQYIPRMHWHYFAMFMIAYEQMTGESANMITNKFQVHANNSIVNDEILQQRSDGWRSFFGSWF